MKTMIRPSACASVALVILLLTGSTAAVAQETGPVTVAEKSGYTQTSLYKDVIQYIHELQGMTSLMRLEYMGHSAEGTPLPLLVIGDPLPADPCQMKNDDRLVLYFQANIHAGEVEGKEASLMLIRDLLLKEKPEFWDRIILLVAPIFNPDGNDKLGHNRRDNGPELAGIRYNGMNLDLNRDGLKQESPELAAFTEGVFNRWDPALFVDCHTTNGSYHTEPVTYLWPLNPNGSAEITSYVRDKLLAWVDTNLEKKYGILSIPYGNYRNMMKPEEGWTPAGPEPRYLVNYVGLRNRLSILLENYAYADFKTRVNGNYHFLLSVLQYCYDHANEIKQLVKKADRTTVAWGLNPARADSFATAFTLKPLGRDITIHGYAMEQYTDAQGRQRYRKSDNQVDYKVPLWHLWDKSACVTRPRAYLISVADQPLLHNLLQHGIEVQRLLEPATLTVESFKVSEVKAADRSYQGHYLNKLSGTVSREEKEFPAGTLFIRTAQPLGNLVVYLLEPQSDDGLFVWNFFDRYLSRQWGRGQITAPVYKLYDEAHLVTETVR